MNHLRRYLTDYLMQCNKLQILAQNIRQAISENPYFQTVSVFERLDKFRKGFLQPADFSQFMLENQIYPTQAELYLIFKDFDRFKKGVVHLQQFQEEILPRENRKLRKTALERYPYPVQLKLQLDLQFLIAKYFQDKIKSIGILNQLRDKIKLLKPDALVEAFTYLDSRKSGYLMSTQQLDNFLRNNGKALTNEQLSRIFRVLNFSLNSEISLAQFQQHIDPFHFGCYQGYKQKMFEKQSLQKRYLNKKYQIEHLRTQNIIDNDRLHYEISQLKNSNRRLKEIIDEQDVMNIYEGRKWYGY